MADITQPSAVTVVQQRLDGRSQGGKESPPDAPPKKVAETYQEVDRAKPPGDRITILGIPVDQITPNMQAALAGLVSEINHLRAMVRRKERAAKASEAGPAVLPQKEFMRALDACLGRSPGEGMVWVMVMVYVATYEDIRRSSGVLAANSALDDVAQRFRDIRFGEAREEPGVSVAAGAAGAKGAPALLAASAPSVTVSFDVVGHCGGSTLCAAVPLPEAGFDTGATARTVRDRLTADGYHVGGLDMALAITVAAAPVGVGESAFLAIGRVDHILRGL